MLTALNELLQTVDARPTPAAYLAASRQLERFTDRLQPVRVALLSSFTIEPLKPYLQVECARRGLAADVYVGKFNTARQELLDPAGECVAYGPDVVFVAELLGDVCPQLTTDFLALNDDDVDQIIDEAVGNAVSAIGAFRHASSAAVVVHNFAMPRRTVLGRYDGMARVSEADAINRLNRRLARDISAIPGAYVLDVCGAAAQVGYRHWYDDRLWFLARTPLAAPALEALAREQAAISRVLRLPARKCLALDLDNTLWGGVLGEAGVAGIALGSGYPGNAYHHFQHCVLQLHRRGVVLALISKNNQHDVDEVFRAHPDMVLKPEHFAATRINWQLKPDNLLEIADELSLGVDSFVFFDDDTAECSLMRHALPEVMTVQAPQDASRLFEVLIGAEAFDRLSITSEDLRRGQMYQEQTARKRAANASGSIEEFLRSLDMSAAIRSLDAFAFPRVANLIEKTNQFNLTTRRYSATDLHAMASDPTQAVFYLQLADRFGDNGIVGVAVLRHHDRIVDLDTLLLSCRVIGRTVETALLAFIIEWAQERGADVMEGDFIPTAKNAAAADFYARHGFQRISETGSAASRWRLAVAETPVQWPSYIQLHVPATA